MIITNIVGDESNLNLQNKKIHIAEFTEEQMQRSHQRFKTADGLDVAISLEVDEKLSDGSVLELEGEDVIIVRAAKEKTFVVSPTDSRSWGKVCYNIGNMHKKAYLTNTEILVPYDAVFENVLKKTGAEYTVEDRRIIGEPANVSAKEHTAHGHHH